MEYTLSNNALCCCFRAAAFARDTASGFQIRRFRKIHAANSAAKSAANFAILTALCKYRKRFLLSTRIPMHYGLQRVTVTYLSIKFSKLSLGRGHSGLHWLLLLWWWCWFCNAKKTHMDRVNIQSAKRCTFVLQVLPKSFRNYKQ